MPLPTLKPDQQSRFAAEIVEALRSRGFDAYWAGGCVRDRLLGRVPKDYDVATNATPAQIRDVFGRRRTKAVGAAFGVILVLGPPGAGQVEVATFRRDAAYLDGRHPVHVTFSTPEQDAARRDFTINGLFYDPAGDRVIDFVGGRDDLANRVLRAIGDPYQRFAEDKLRLLRAVRFAARFELAVEPNTLAAVRRMASQITTVSAERIAEEMRTMLTDRDRASAVGMLADTGLAAAVLPEVFPPDGRTSSRLGETLEVLKRLENPGFPLALATLLYPSVGATDAERVCRRWRLSNRETDRVVWLVAHRETLWHAASMPWSRLQRLLIAAGIDDLLTMNEAAARAGFGDLEEVLWCRAQRAEKADALNPPPLLTGDDLVQQGISPGPLFREILQRIRDAQLDGQIHTKAESLTMADRIRREKG